VRGSGRNTALVAGALCALITAGLGERPESPPAPVWGQRAEKWLANAQEAAQEGIPNLEAFLTPDVVLDHRGTGGPVAEGVDASLGVIRDLGYTQPGIRLGRPAYLSPTGLVVPFSWDGEHVVEDGLLVMLVSSEGLVREETASSMRTGQRLVDPDRDWGSLQELARRYVAARTGGGATATLDTLPGNRGPAVFAIPNRRSEEGFRQAFLLLESTDASGCTGRMAVSLTLDPNGVVTEERRYQRIGDTRLCLKEGRRVAGWWTTMDVPDPVQQVRTGNVTEGAVDVEIWNGTPALESLVRAALRRFPAAGLPAPRPRSVTFFPAADRCLGNLAVAGGEGNTEIIACFGEGLACPVDPCPPWATRAEVTMLHELAHTWMTQNLSEQDRADYEQLVFLRWASSADPWEDRAIERAAAVIAWGLQASPSPPQEFPLSEAQLVREYYFLTGRLPMSRRDSSA
jgi:hypothetical protein